MTSEITSELSINTLLPAFNAAVARINEMRGSQQLASHFYRQAGNSVFLTFWEALTDTHLFGRERKRLHVVSAPAGAGKSTFSNACIAALIGTVPNGGPLGAPASALVVVEQIRTAEARYRDLEALLPGKVACWTSGFATVNRKDDLACYPVAIVTHAMFTGVHADKARRWGHGRRTVTVVDERIKEVAIYDVSPAAVSRVWETVNDDGGDTAKAALDVLNQFVASRVCNRAAIDRLEDDEARVVIEGLRWFNTRGAERYVRDHKDTAAVFGFARSLADNYAFIAGEGGETHLIGYQNTMSISPGTVLLDATADIDGVQQLCLPGRRVHAVPSVNYAGLQTVLVTPPTKGRLSDYLRKHDNAVKYRDWIVGVIKQHVEPGQKALVVCRLDLTEQRGRYLPNWDRDDGRWSRLQEDPTAFAWDLEGRAVAVTYWGGDNIGNNAWQEADTVLLFDADYKPRRVVLADTQGLLKAHPTAPGTPLAEMTSVRRKHAVVDGYAVGGLLRAHKQLALRGRARRFDEHGQCGQQKLVCGLSDPSWLLENCGFRFNPAGCSDVKPATVPR